MAALTGGDRQVTAAGALAATRSPCAVCGDSIAQDEQAVRCPGCGIDYHADCWTFIGRPCGRLGCNGGSEPARDAPAASPPPTTAQRPRPLRVGESDLGAVEPQVSPVQNQDLIAGSWATPRLAALAGGLGALFLDLLFHLTASALRWAMGDGRLHATAGLHGFVACAGAGWWLWLLGGGAYGILHRRYLAGTLPNLYPPLRLLLGAVLLGNLALGLGHLPFLLTYRRPDWLWGLPAALTWMPRYFAWAMLGMACWRALAAYSLPGDLFQKAGEVFGLALGLAFNATVTALLLGAFLRAIGWLAGGCLDLVVDGHHLAARIAGTLGFWGMNAGFVGACLLALSLGPARQLRGRQAG
jgi:Prokaryotic RING finger family 1